jgi:selenide,water dikinase
MAAMDIIPGGSLNNFDFVSPHVSFSNEISRIDRIILADAQTSGGLLISLPEDQAKILLTSLSQKGITTAIVGRMTDKGEGKIIVK